MSDDEGADRRGSDGDERPDPLEDALADDRDADDALADDQDAEGADPVDRFIKDVTERPDGDADPFEAMGTGPDPRGDPFTRLDREESDDSAGAHGAETAGSSPAPETTAGAQSSDAGDDPFAGFEGGAGDPFGPGESVFERVDVGGVDSNGVWERMDREEGDDAVQEVPGRRYVEVSKHSYCERCEYFSGPPEVSCSHEGTQILEFTDMETVRLVDCPIVAERRAIEDEN